MTTKPDRWMLAYKKTDPVEYAILPGKLKANGEEHAAGSIVIRNAETHAMVDVLPADAFWEKHVQDPASRNHVAMLKQYLYSLMQSMDQLEKERGHEPGSKQDEARIRGLLQHQKMKDMDAISGTRATAGALLSLLVAIDPLVKSPNLDASDDESSDPDGSS